jgi:tetratricopeptide (TPR) repeat protein
VLRGVLELAVAHGLDEHCWKLAWFWAPKLKRLGRMHEVLAVQRTALASADRLDDAAALAHVHYDLGHVSDWLGDYPAADLHLRRALELFTELGDRPGVGHAQHGLALLLAGQDRYAEALEHAYEGLRLRRAFGDSAAVASAENAAGWILAHLGRCDDGPAPPTPSTASRSPTASPATTCAPSTTSSRPSGCTGRSATPRPRRTRCRTWATPSSPTGSPTPPGAAGSARSGCWRRSPAPTRARPSAASPG